MRTWPGVHIAIGYGCSIRLVLTEELEGTIQSRLITVHTPRAESEVRLWNPRQQRQVINANPRQYRQIIIAMVTRRLIVIKYALQFYAKAINDSCTHHFHILTVTEQNSTSWRTFQNCVRHDRMWTLTHEASRWTNLYILITWYPAAISHQLHLWTDLVLHV